MVDDDKKSEPIIDPAPDRPLGPEDRPSYWNSAPGKSVRKGAKWGSIAGFIAAQSIIASNSIDTPFGSIYGGNMLAVFAVFIGLGTGLGAGIVWLSTQKIDDEDDRPPPPLDFPREPYG